MMEHRILNGIHFLRLRGNFIERAHAHSLLLRDVIPQGPIPMLAKKNEWVIRRGNGLLKLPPIQALAVFFYKKILIPWITSTMSADEKKGIRLMSENSDYSYEDWRETLFQADALMILARTSIMKHLLSEWIPGALPGCTSAIVKGNWTQSGRLLACRNLDYFVVGPWERTATVVFNEPTDPGTIPFVSLTAAGVQVGGVTAVNQEGITLAAHAHFGRNVSFNGRSIVLLGDDVISKAKTLGQAVDILRKNHTYANWSFVLSSAKENNGIVVEMSPKRVAVREMNDGFLAHTNYFHDAELRKTEALLSGSCCDDLKERICQIRNQLEPHRGHLEPFHFSQALGNHFDASAGQERVFGNTLSVVTTVKSAVFDAGAQKFWMSSRQESPVGLGDYIEVDMNRFWKESLDDYKKSMTHLPHYTPKAPHLVEAIHHYREAYRAYHTDNQLDDYQEQALEHIKKATVSYPQDGHLWLQAGIVALTLKQVTDAKSYLENALSCTLSEHTSCVRDLYLARCYDLLGQRQAALPLYQRSVLRAVEPRLKKALSKGLKSPYRNWEIAFIQVDLQFPDTFHY